MYNETTKRAFVSTLSSKQNILLATALFNSIEIFEQESEKDISRFTEENLQKVQVKIAGSKTYGFGNIVNLKFAGVFGITLPL